MNLNCPCCGNTVFNVKGWCKGCNTPVTEDIPKWFTCGCATREHRDGQPDPEPFPPDWEIYEVDAIPNRTIWLGVVEFGDGDNVFASETEEGCWKQMADYARSFNQGEEGEPPDNLPDVDTVQEWYVYSDGFFYTVPNKQEVK